jgi:hypothetical protein
MISHTPLLPEYFYLRLNFNKGMEYAPLESMVKAIEMIFNYC